MSTTAGIGMRMADGSVRAVRLNYDGYPGHAGAVLGGWYRTAEQVEALLALGELSQIGETPETCVAYRDRGGEHRQPVAFGTADEYRLTGQTRLAADYLYIFDGGKWNFCGGFDNADWYALEVVVCEKEA